MRGNKYEQDAPLRRSRREPAQPSRAATGNGDEAAGAGADRPAGYEFSEVENQRFTRLAGTMQLVAGLMLCCGLAFAIVVFPTVAAAIARSDLRDAIKPLGSVLVPLVVGGWTFRAGSSLRLITRTEGNDIAHLMDAVAALTKLYLLQVALWLVALGAIAWLLLAST